MQGATTQHSGPLGAAPALETQVVRELQESAEDLAKAFSHRLGGLAAVSFQLLLVVTVLRMIWSWIHGQKVPLSVEVYFALAMALLALGQRRVRRQRRYTLRVTADYLELNETGASQRIPWEELTKVRIYNGVISLRSKGGRIALPWYRLDDEAQSAILACLTERAPEQAREEGHLLTTVLVFLGIVGLLALTYSLVATAERAWP